MDAREKILTTFRQLVLSQPYDQFNVQTIVKEAGVARSTFYSQFRDKDHLLIESLHPIIEALDNLAAGKHDSATIAMLEHVWENRFTGRILFKPPLVQRISGALCSAHLSEPAYLFRLYGILGLMGAWCNGQILLSPKELNEFLAEKMG